MTILFSYCGQTYPDYIRRGNAMQHIAATAAHFCEGAGVDVGAGKWPFRDAVPVDIAPGGPQRDGCCAMSLPMGPLDGGLWDYIFSSHCLEHLEDPVAALEHWRSRLRRGGVLFVYLPHPDMRYWRPENCRKHRHMWWPKDMADMLRTLGFVDVLYGERDLAWSFAVVGYNGFSMNRHG